MKAALPPETEPGVAGWQVGAPRPALEPRVPIPPARSPKICGNLLVSLQQAAGAPPPPPTDIQSSSLSRAAPVDALLFTKNREFPV